MLPITRKKTPLASASAVARIPGPRPPYHDAMITAAVSSRNGWSGPRPSTTSFMPTVTRTAPIAIPYRRMPDTRGEISVLPRAVSGLVCTFIGHAGS